MIWLATAWKWIGSKAALIAGAGLAIWFAIAQIKKAGRNEEKVAQHERADRRNTQAHDVARSTDARSDADVDRLLRQRWSR